MKTAKRLFILLILISLALGNAPFALAAPRRGEPKVYYYLHDHLGGISAVTDEEGNVVERRDYLPFGADRLLPDAQYGNYRDYGFTGKEKDPESELYYYGARFYDPFTGRFISPDPLTNALDNLSPRELQKFLENPQDWNSYSYARNNPIVYKDPDGQFPIHVFIGAAVGAALNVGIQAASDFVSGEFSGLAKYAGLAAGGAASGAMFAVDPGMVMSALAGAIEGAVSTLTQHAINNKPLDPQELGENALLGAVTNLTPGPNITAGSATRVAKQMNTKLQKGTINRVSPKTAAKMAIRQAVHEAPGAFFQAVGDKIMTYIVQKGDTLSKIFGNAWRSVAAYNHLDNPNSIRPGQVLKLPNKED